jgi:hypothetical protein
VGKLEAQSTGDFFVIEKEVFFYFMKVSALEY